MVGSDQKNKITDTCGGNEFPRGFSEMGKLSHLGRGQSGAGHLVKTLLWRGFLDTHTTTGDMLEGQMSLSMDEERLRNPELGMEGREGGGNCTQNELINNRHFI